MTSFRCPFCGTVIGKLPPTYTSLFLPHEKIRRDPIGNCIPAGDVIQFEFFFCSVCHEMSVTATRQWGDHPFIANIYPRAAYMHVPDYVPAAIRTDYQEACTILQDSPRAAATLCRRCLQGMIRDAWGISGGSLNDEITQLKSMIPPLQWSVLDALRKLGNIGAHMEKDVNLIIDIDRDTAAKLIAAVERLIKDWYIDRHETNELYNSILSASADAEAKRHP